MTKRQHVRAALTIAALTFAAAYAGWQGAASGQERTPPAPTRTTNTNSNPANPPPANPPPANPPPANPPSANLPSANPRPASTAPVNAPPVSGATAHVHARGDEARCATCHATLPDGRLRTRLPQGQLKPKGPWLGMAHDRDWLVRHRWVAADRGNLCAQCHKERDCTQCHDSRVRPRAIHPNDWLTLHPQHARRSAVDCQGCHSLQTFCTECHARLGISQMAAPGTRTGQRFHPPAAQWVGSVNAHAREAKRSLSTCISCHAENDCVRCHAAGRSTGAASPHPAGFSGHCRAQLLANTRACVACHGPDLTALRAICR